MKFQFWAPAAYLSTYIQFQNNKIGNKKNIFCHVSLMPFSLYKNMLKIFFFSFDNRVLPRKELRYISYTSWSNLYRNLCRLHSQFPCNMSLLSVHIRHNAFCVVATCQWRTTRSVHSYANGRWSRTRETRKKITEETIHSVTNPSIW